MGSESEWGTQMHSEVKKFNRDKAEIVVRQAEVEIQVIRYITVQNHRNQGIKRVVGESMKTMSIPGNQTNDKHNRIIKQTLGGEATKYKTQDLHDMSRNTGHRLDRTGRPGTGNMKQESWTDNYRCKQI